MTASAAGGGRLRLAFLGSPDFAVPALRALRGAGHEIAAVYCQPPRPAGRGRRDQESDHPHEHPPQGVSEVRIRAAGGRGG